MSTEQLYDVWSSTYDTVVNKTRDLEKVACQKILSSISFETVIELGCGTGKNTEWLATQAKHVTAVDLSADMQAVAKQKIKNGNVEFRLADIIKLWDFGQIKVDLITCSLILEHVADLDPIFAEAYRHLNTNGHFYVCELHPFRQYNGSKARFENEEGMRVLEYFTHDISDFTGAALKNGLSVVGLEEWFDDDERTATPRLASFLFLKN